ncbi:MAG: hypothetical protein J1F38_06265 [Muribaculaceae bacterium]|nr:hypothetical protein [Muribaculaceae bacterium]
MKNFKYILLGISSIMLASCSQEALSPTPESGEPTIANFSINLPKDFSTRSIGDGLTATQLSAYVYEVTTQNAENSYNYIFTGHSTFANDSYTTTITLELVTGKSYFIAFFASSSNSSGAYTVDTTTGELSVDYSAMSSSNNLLDAYDCFNGTYATGLVGNSSISGTVNLTRPVAQLNWGTTGLSANSNFETEFGANGDYILTDLKIASAYTTFNLIKGTYGGETEVNINSMASPATLPGISYPVSNYRYVAMQYVLAPSETPATYDLDLTIRNNGGNNTSGTYNQTITVSNAPVQADYQTNIYGSLLAAATNLTISKEQGANWNTYNEPQTWDGTATTPTINQTNKTVSLNSPSDLAGLAALVNSSTSPTDFKDFVITLNADFDMNNLEFPTLGSGTRSGADINGNSFRGTFDGQGHTISNLNISGSTNSGDAIGFIPNLDGSAAVVKNVIFNNLIINAPSNEQVGAVATVTNGATVSNVMVKSGTITAAEGAGGVTGRLIENGTIDQCSNYATINTGTNGGGIVGAAYRTASGVTATVSNCANYGNVTGSSQGIGGIVGLSSAVVTGCSNEGTVTGATTSTGGIVGQQNDAGSITNCTNSGKVVGGNNYGAGGIVGWVRYTNSSAYALQNIITVSHCKNTASVSGAIGVGGIVGVWYACGICTNNTNTAASLSATNQFVAGIVGTSQWTESGPSSNVTGNKDMLYVEYNYSTTSQTAMTGGAKADFIYVNSPANTTVENNSMTDPSIVATPFN